MCASFLMQQELQGVQFDVLSVLAKLVHQLPAHSLKTCSALMYHLKRYCLHWLAGVIIIFDYIILIIASYFSAGCC